MKSGGIVLLLAVITAIMWFGFMPAASAPAGGQFRASLSGFEETPATLSSAGSGRFTARIAGSTIEYELSYEDLVAVSAAHIHLGRPATSGGVSAFLCGGGGKPDCPAEAGTVSGTIVPSDVTGPAAQGIAAGEFDELVRAIRNGATYVNVHTSAFPGGEIRGQIRRGGGNNVGNDVGNDDEDDD
jgi:hypothetical protein